VFVVGELTFALNAFDVVLHVTWVREALGDFPSTWFVLGVEYDCRFHVYVV